jgi:hypothetical protein
MALGSGVWIFNGLLSQSDQNQFVSAICFGLAAFCALDSIKCAIDGAVAQLKK